MRLDYKEGMKIPQTTEKVTENNHRLVIMSIFGFWLFYLAIVSLRSYVLNYPVQGEMLFRRTLVIICGIIITYGLYLLLLQFENCKLPMRILVAVILAMPCALIIASFNYLAFNIYVPESLFEDQKIMQVYQDINPLIFILEFAISRYFFLVSWTMLYLALSYARDVRIAERHAATLAKAAQQAELRSLRYQVNPHFLFNTLNSLSSLVLRDNSDAAEEMIMNLSEFYRHSLASDPLADISLEEEVTLQQLYLQIEMVRFPDRLRVEMDIDDDAKNCLVPSLILQPIVENAIKYGVSRTTRPVTITITAHCDNGQLLITIHDDGDFIVDVPGSQKISRTISSGIGLVNVRDRLQAGYGEDAKVTWQQNVKGGFTVAISLPICKARAKEELFYDN